MANELRDAIVSSANELGVDPLDIATAISYETAGTFDPNKQGPGGHEGLIQWGASERAHYGVYEGMPVADQMKAVTQYLKDRGVRPGMGLMDIYSAINAGHVGLYDRSDAANGGAPGTVADKVNYQMAGHKRKAKMLLGGSIMPQIGKEINPFEAPNFNPADILPNDNVSGTPAGFGLNWSTPPEDIPITPDGAMPSVQPGHLRLAADAIMTANSLGDLFRARPDQTVDPNYRLTPDKLKGYLQGLDPETYASWFDKASSEANAQSIRQSALDDFKRRQELAGAGLEGDALSIASALLDPVAWGAGLATDGLGVAAVAGAKLSKPAWLLYNTALGSASGAASVAATAPFVPGVSKGQVIGGAVLGGALGTAIGAFGKNPAMLDELARFRQAAGATADSYHGTVPANGNAGAAAVTASFDDFLKDVEAAKIQDNEVPKTFMAALRRTGMFDIGGALRSSRNPLTRWLGTHLTKDAADPTVMTATEEKRKFTDLWTAAYARTYQPALKEYLKETGKSTLRPLAAHDAQIEFNEQVARFVRDRNELNFDQYPESVRRVGKKIREVQNEIRKLANNPLIMEGLSGRSVKGFEELAENPNYLMRVWDAKKVADAREAFGDSGLASAIEQAMQKANPNIERALRKRAAAAFARAIAKRSAGVDDRAARILGTDNLNEVVDILTHEGNLSEADAKQLVKKFQVSDNTEAPARGKKRVLLDETAPITVRNRFTGEEHQTSIQDLLLVNDANFLFHKYAHQMSGRIALARLRLPDPKTGEILVNGITSDLEAEQLLKMIDKRGADLKISEKQRQADLDRFRYLMKYLEGYATRDVARPNLEHWLQAFEKFNYIRVMNQAGFAQLPEISGVLTTAGLKAMFTHMPAFRRILSPNGDAELIKQAARDVEHFIAYGAERLTHRDFRRFDDMAGHVNSYDRGQLVDKVNAVADHLSHWTSDVSGMNIVNMGIQRWAGIAMLQKFVDMAHGAGKLTKARLRSLGLDEGMTERIFKELRDPKNVETVRGALTGHKIKKMHFENWTDKEAREAFRNALFRSSHQIIQTNDIGMMGKWMSHPIGRILVQFRRFTFGSFTNHLLYNMNLLRHGDMRAGAFFLMSTLFTALSYALWQQIKTLGMSDRDEVLQKRLSFDNVAKASFSRNGWSSILPMLFDSTLARPLFGKNQFDYRTSGQSNDILFGNPTTDLFGDAGQALQAITAPWINDRSMTQKEWKDLTRVLPFYNSLPFAITMNAMTSGLEPRPPRDDFQD